MAERKQIFSEGELFNKWMDNRFKRNKNVIIAITGSTGSGKTYAALKISSLWYQYKFKKNFAEKVTLHVCFSVGAVMKILSSGKLKKGDLIIYEEAGTSFGNLDFQNQVSKMFSYILQSFRSMNVGLIFTLPVLTMLNKSARLLLHAHFITQSINPYLETCSIKPLFHQLNQEKGKSYWKYMRVKYDGSMVAIERFTYSLPSKEITDIYEDMKFKFVNGLAESFSKQLDDIEKEEQRKMGRSSLTDAEQEVFEDVIELGMTPVECSEKRKRSKTRVYEILHQIKRKGFAVAGWIKYRDSKGKSVQQQINERNNKKSLGKLEKQGAKTMPGPFN